MTLHAKYQSSMRCGFLEAHEKIYFGCNHSSPLFSDFVELYARNMLSFIQFGQVGKRKMLKQMFDARRTLSFTISHVDSLGQVSLNGLN